ncbi:hypothetical protein [Pontibacter sp. H249]|uniref:hypothetical protein n=1 Tax=Pontibacter sp. H249 TaxID=3133420 RepID=UPI0030C1380D
MMKTGINLTKLLYFLVLLFCFSSCEKDTIRLTKYTEEWLQTKTDTKLNFTSHTGEKEELTVTVKTGTHIRSNLSGDRKYEYYLLTYTGKQSDLGLILAAEDKYVDIMNIGQTEFNTNFVSITTGKTAAEEVLLTYDVEAEFINNLELNGVTYNKLLRLKFNLPPSRPDKIKEVYYAKNHGLVYFQTTDGQYWSLD